MYSKFGQPPLKLPHTWGDTHWAGLGWPHSGAAIVEWSLVGHFVANLQQNETFLEYEAAKYQYIIIFPFCGVDIIGKLLILDFMLHLIERMK